MLQHHNNILKIYEFVLPLKTLSSKAHRCKHLFLDILCGCLFGIHCHFVITFMYLVIRMYKVKQRVPLTISSPKFKLSSSLRICIREKEDTKRIYKLKKQTVNALEKTKQLKTNNSSRNSS